MKNNKNHIDEWKKDRRIPIRTIKAKKSAGIDMAKMRKKYFKKIKETYDNKLEEMLASAVAENREMKNWDETPGRIMPAESRKSGVSEPKVRREGDEWVVMLNGRMFRISTDDAATREEAIAVARKNSKVKESKETVSVLYIDGVASTKYVKPAEAAKEAERLRAKFPNKKIEIKNGVTKSEGWTHDSLAARLFEQDLTYEDELARKLSERLKK